VICVDGLSQAEREKILESAGLSMADLNALVGLTYFGHEHQPIPKDVTSSTFRYSFQYRRNNDVSNRLSSNIKSKLINFLKNKTASTFDESENTREWENFDRYKPTIFHILEDQINGQLKGFPYVEDRTGRSDAKGLKSAVRKPGEKQQGRGIVFDFKTNFRPKWGKEVLNVPGTKTDDDYRRNGPKIILIVMGGLTFGETRAVYELAAKYKREIIIGSTHIIKPYNFVDTLHFLGKSGAPILSGLGPQIETPDIKFQADNEAKSTKASSPPLIAKAESLGKDFVVPFPSSTERLIDRRRVAVSKSFSGERNRPLLSASLDSNLSTVNTGASVLKKDDGDFVQLTSSPTLSVSGDGTPQQDADTTPSRPRRSKVGRRRPLSGVILPGNNFSLEMNESPTDTDFEITIQCTTSIIISSIDDSEAPNGGDSITVFSERVSVDAIPNNDANNDDNIDSRVGIVLTAEGEDDQMETSHENHLQLGVDTGMSSSPNQDVTSSYDSKVVEVQSRDSSTEIEQKLYDADGTQDSAYTTDSIKSIMDEPSSEVTMNPDYEEAISAETPQINQSSDNDEILDSSLQNSDLSHNLDSTDSSTSPQEVSASRVDEIPSIEVPEEVSVCDKSEASDVIDFSQKEPEPIIKENGEMVCPLCSANIPIRPKMPPSLLWSLHREMACFISDSEDEPADELNGSISPARRNLIIAKRKSRKRETIRRVTPSASALLNFIGNITQPERPTRNEPSIFKVIHHYKNFRGIGGHWNRITKPETETNTKTETVILTEYVIPTETVIPTENENEKKTPTFEKLKREPTSVQEIFCPHCSLPLKVNNRMSPSLVLSLHRELICTSK
jgi:hypothetical protein